MKTLILCAALVSEETALEIGIVCWCVCGGIWLLIQAAKLTSWCKEVYRRHQREKP